VARPKIVVVAGLSFEEFSHEMGLLASCESGFSPSFQAWQADSSCIA
jgi:hypothetical protein